MPPPAKATPEVRPEEVGTEAEEAVDLTLVDDPDEVEESKANAEQGETEEYEDEEQDEEWGNWRNRPQQSYNKGTGKGKSKKQRKVQRQE